MIPLSLEIENFFSHTQSRIDLQNRGLVLITGSVRGNTGISSNGAGKTSLLVEPLVYALFGRTLRGVRGDAVVNRYRKKNCVVIFTCQTEAGAQIEIGRPHKHQQHSKPWVTVDGQTAYGNDQVDQVVHSILGLSFETFTTSVIFGHGNVKFFTQLGDTERKDILDDLLGLHDLDALDQVIFDESLLVEEAHAEVERAITSTQAQLAQVGRHLASAKETAETFVTTQQGKHDDLYRTITDAQQRQVHTVELLRVLTNQKLDYAQRLLPIAPQVQDASTQVAQRGEEEQRMDALLSAALLAQRHCEQRLQHWMVLPDVCPTCRQSVTGQLRAVQCAEATTALAEAKNATDAVDAEALLAKQAAETARAALLDAMATQGQLEAEYTATTTKLESTYDQFNALQQTLESHLIPALEALQTAKNTHQEAVLRFQVEKDALQAQLADHSASAGLTARNLEMLKYWKHAVGNGGLKNAILLQAIPFLNERAEYYGQLLTDGAVRVDFSTTQQLKSGDVRNRFDVRVEVRQGGASYTEISDGQRRRADIIATLALGDLARSRSKNAVDLLILDEIGDGLDAAGVERLMGLLNALARTRGSVFVISHAPEFQTFFPTIIEVVNENGCSSIAA